MTEQIAPVGSYCEACRWESVELELCEVVGGFKFMFCELCAAEHKAIPVKDIEEARVRVWKKLAERIGQ